MQLSKSLSSILNTLIHQGSGETVLLLDVPELLELELSMMGVSGYFFNRFVLSHMNCLDVMFV
jgi:hypothetical protein